MECFFNLRMTFWQLIVISLIILYTSGAVGDWPRENDKPNSKNNFNDRDSLDEDDNPEQLNNVFVSLRLVQNSQPTERPQNTVQVETPTRPSRPSAPQARMDSMPQQNPPQQSRVSTTQAPVHPVQYFQPQFEGQAIYYQPEFVPAPLVQQPPYFSTRVIQQPQPQGAMIFTHQIPPPALMFQQPHHHDAVFVYQPEHQPAPMFQQPLLHEAMIFQRPQAPPNRQEFQGFRNPNQRPRQNRNASRSYGESPGHPPTFLRASSSYAGNQSGLSRNSSPHVPKPNARNPQQVSGHPQLDDLSRDGDLDNSLRQRFGNMQHSHTHPRQSPSYPERRPYPFTTGRVVHNSASRALEPILSQSPSTAASSNDEETKPKEKKSPLMRNSSTQTLENSNTNAQRVMEVRPVPRNYPREVHPVSRNYPREAHPVPRDHPREAHRDISRGHGRLLTHDRQNEVTRSQTQRPSSARFLSEVKPVEGAQLPDLHRNMSTFKQKRILLPQFCKSCLQGTHSKNRREAYVPRSFLKEGEAFDDRQTFSGSVKIIETKKYTHAPGFESNPNKISPITQRNLIDRLSSLSLLAKRSPGPRNARITTTSTNIFPTTERYEQREIRPVRPQRHVRDSLRKIMSRKGPPAELVLLKASSGLSSMRIPPGMTVIELNTEPINSLQSSTSTDESVSLKESTRVLDLPKKSLRPSEPEEQQNQKTNNPTAAAGSSSNLDLSPSSVDDPQKGQQDNEDSGVSTQVSEENVQQSDQKVVRPSSRASRKKKRSTLRSMSDVLEQFESQANDIKRDFRLSLDQIYQDLILTLPRQQTMKNSDTQKVTIDGETRNGPTDAPDPLDQTTPSTLKYERTQLRRLQEIDNKSFTANTPFMEALYKQHPDDQYFLLNLDAKPQAPVDFVREAPPQPQSIIHKVEFPEEIPRLPDFASIRFNNHLRRKPALVQPQLPEETKFPENLEFRAVRDIDLNLFKPDLSMIQ